MYKCQQCDADVEVVLGDLDVKLGTDADNITGAVRLEINCGDCGSALLECTFAIQEDDEEFITEHNKEAGEHEITITSDIHAVEDAPRNVGGSTCYGAEGSIYLMCTCGEKEEIPWSDSATLSYFDDIQ